MTTLWTKQFVELNREQFNAISNGFTLPCHDYRQTNNTFYHNSNQSTLFQRKLKRQDQSSQTSPFQFIWAGMPSGEGGGL